MTYGEVPRSVGCSYWLCVR